jgi:diacylglycerol kinase family enzyme
VLSDVLDSEEAQHVRRVVTDEIDDVREAIAGLGQRVKLLCIYGGDGTIFRVLNDLFRHGTTTPPRIALLGGGTMNVTSAWCGMSRKPGENFRRVMRAYMSGKLLWREVPLLSVKHDEHTAYAFTFGLGPLVRILERFEAGQKSKGNAVGVGVKSIAAALSGMGREYKDVLREAQADVTIDDLRVPYDRFAAVFANVTGVINPLVEPFVGDRDRDSFYFLSYAVSAREFAWNAPLLARARRPMDPRSLLHPVSTWRQLMLTLSGKEGIPSDPRYVNQTARRVAIDTTDTHYTLDGEVFSVKSPHFDLGLGPTLQLATL